MRGHRRWTGAVALVASVVAAGAAVAGEAPIPIAVAPGSDMARMDLSKTFATRSPWRLSAIAGAPGEDFGGHPAPGPIKLCLRKGAGEDCTLDLVQQPAGEGDGDTSLWAPHYLNTAKPVYPGGPSKPPLLLLVTSSTYSGDGDQMVVTQLLRYDRGADRFLRVFARNVGHNNNQEIRFVERGPLRGDVIIATPTQKAPFNYWIEVQKPTAAGAYKSALRFRSATHYGDGNPLAVIDSEAPNIERRLGLWKPGQPLAPLDGAKICAKAHLKNGSLWCQ